MNRTVFAAFGAFCLLAAPVAFAQTDAPPASTAKAETPAASAGVIEPAAWTILQKSADAMLSFKTFRADCFQTVTFPVSATGKTRPPRYALSTLIAAKPNRMRYEQRAAVVPEGAQTAFAKWTRKAGDLGMTFVSDGKTHWQQFGSSYRKDAHTEPDYLTTILEPWTGFYTKNGSPFSSLQYAQKEKGLLELRVDGTETVDGVLCDVVRYHTTSEYNGDAVDSVGRYCIGRDGVVRRQVDVTGFSGKPGNSRDAVVRNIVLNAAVPTPKTTFAYTPPKGVASEAARRAAEPVLLAKGTSAPDFTATDSDNKPVKLSDLRGKVVVLDFWASWCPPCVASMPHNQKVIAKLQAEGLPVVLLAVDNSEERDAFSTWVKAHPEMSALRFAHVPRESSDVAGKLYNVSGIPTQYVIGADGTVRSSTVGFGGETDAMETAIRAAVAAP